jgi:phosphotriesterase-related protein
LTIRTVLGDISPSELGVTLCHEHIFANAAQGYWHEQTDPEKRRVAEAPISLEIMGPIRRAICLNKDNLVWNSRDDALFELRKYVTAGGKSIADVSHGADIRERASDVQELSKLTGVNIIPSTGWYIGATHDDFVSRATVEELRDFMIRELTVGIGDSGIRAGVMGELGCSGPLQPSEKKVLLSAAKAQLDTGAPITLHVPHFDYVSHKHVREADKYLEVMGNDINPEKVWLSHMDFAYHIDDDDLDFQRKIMDKGISISYDRFGLEGVYDEDHFPGALEACTDTERVNAIVKLCENGYDKKLMLAHDACMKMQFAKYGGYGYAHVLEHIVPILKLRGLTDHQIDNMLKDNPKRIFDW